MLVKEYRIPLPLTVEEYRIAQLYMIQKKSRDESSGAGSGVEIIKNQPYTDGPSGTNGQYTYKIYHIGSHLPNWLRAILPKTALQVHEEAWNAYPYTKTIFRCPFVEKFSIAIETVYKQDGGTQENVFNLDSQVLRNRNVDVLDFVQDSVPPNDYKAEEDPIIYVSKVTGRGPLKANWLKERTVMPSAGPVMCAYKLCWVEFKYWGMQSKIEKFIDESALRKTMVRAHRQAWAWQDEWHGLTIDDIRDLERQTQKALAEKMLAANKPNQLSDEPSNQSLAINNLDDGDGMNSTMSTSSPQSTPNPVSRKETSDINRRGLDQSSSEARSSWQSIEKYQDESDEEFFDAHSEIYEDELSDRLGCLPSESPKTLQKSSSLDYIAGESDSESSHSNSLPASAGTQDSPVRRAKEHELLEPEATSSSMSLLFIVIHGGSAYNGNALLVETDKRSKMGDLCTLKATFEKVISLHYSNFIGRYQVKLAACPSIHSDALNLLSSISPYSSKSSESGSFVYSEHFPISAVPLLASQSVEYQDSLITVANRVNKVYRDFILSDEGHGFNGQVILIGDCMGSLMAFDVLCSQHAEPSFHIGPYSQNSKKYASDTNLAEPPPASPNMQSAEIDFSASLPSSRLSTAKMQLPANKPMSSAQLASHGSIGAGLMETRGFEFEVSEFFMFGSPLALVLAQRVIQDGPDSHVRPNCFQVFNLFHASDPCGGRVESLLESTFSRVDTVKIPRYQKFPLGDGKPLSLLECLQQNGIYTDESASPREPTRSDSYLVRQGSNASYLSSTSADVNICSITSVARKWWGNKRIDYTMYCPDGLENFPHNALPHLFHASYWESFDAAAFILRQVLGQDMAEMQVAAESSGFSPHQPREKWLSRRTALKTKNITPNHRGNDVIASEDKSQIVTAKFMYGPLDVVTLSNEKIDIHMITDRSNGEWEYLETKLTDKYGRVRYMIPFDRRLSAGLYPVKMIVRGDHTYVDLSLLVVPPNTNIVVFSIDGSFTASVSIMGKDPKVRPGAVDVVRHWQDFGYVVLYVSARPDMQLRKVVTWLAQHNFPHGMVAFMDGFTPDNLKQKTNYLKQLIKEAEVKVVAAYGSYKDIAVYQACSIPTDCIHVIGKVPKKAHQLPVTLLLNGYAAHLQTLQTASRIAPSNSNVRLFLDKSAFPLPGKSRKIERSQSVKVNSPNSSQFDKVYPAISVDQCGKTTIDGSGGPTARPRGRLLRQSVHKRGRSPNPDSNDYS